MINTVFLTIITAIFNSRSNIYVSACSASISKIKYGKGQYVEIEILEKLPIERATRHNTGGANSKRYFYPVRGKDITTGYESVCYVKKEEYKSSAAQDVIRVIRFIDDYN